MTEIYIQRGNRTAVVQWTGFNVDEVREFILPRLASRNTAGEADQEWWSETTEFFVTQFRDLIVSMHARAGKPLNPLVIPRAYWLVDQAEVTEVPPCRFVICSDERFHKLYRKLRGSDDGD